MKYQVDPADYDPIDAMRTAEWMEEMEKDEKTPDRMDGAVVAGDDHVCPTCGEPTYINAFPNGPDDFQLQEFCVKHGMVD